MTPERLRQLKANLRRLWVLSPERLWLRSIALQDRGHWVLAFWLKQLNSLIYHNSLAPGASVSPDVYLGHNSLGIVINSNVEIGRRVTIWHNVTLAAGRGEKRAKRSSEAPANERRGGEDGGPPPGPKARIIVEDSVKIGAHAVIIAPRSTTLRIGRGARIGAGTVVTQDVPPGSTVVGPAPRVLTRKAPADGPGVESAEVESSEVEHLD